MGLALGDLADVVRAHPGAIERLRAADDETLLASLDESRGGTEVRRAIESFLERYGMRGTGEIDLTRPRWREAPTQLIPAIESHMKCGSPGEHRRAFLAGEERGGAGRGQAPRATEGRRLSGGSRRRVMRRLIAVYRSRIGLREHPKYYIVQLLDLAKRAILAGSPGTDGRRDPCVPGRGLLVLALRDRGDPADAAGRSRSPRRAEGAVRAGRVASPAARSSRARGRWSTAPPGQGVPAGALAGTAASAGVVEGRARVVRKLEEARIEKGDILVAPYTDPAWTPLFPIAAGLVTEVGGLMTHGAVVAREYGIPAVVGVDRRDRGDQGRGARPRERDAGIRRGTRRWDDEAG